jgi:hypothetical protein
VLHAYVPIIGINGIDAAISQHISNFSWVKWGHRIGELAAQHAMKPHEALEIVSNLHFARHPIHGAVWGLIEQRHRLDDMWEYFDASAGFIRGDARSRAKVGTGEMPPLTAGHSIWIQACHGVGHALTWWAPTGSTETSGLSATSMVDYCLQRGSAGIRSALDDTCSAACTSGMFHEASTAGILHSIANDAPHPCANLERHTLFCYAVSPAQSFTHCYELSASLRNQAGCVAALGIPDSFRIERSEIASPICAEVRSRSVALWLACGYGAAWWYSMMKVHASTTMGHSPAMGHSGRSVAARCIGTWPHDEFAREICIQEASVVFSSAFLLDDLEFLTQLNFPAEFLATHEGTFQSLFERVRSTWRVTNADVSQPLLDVASGRDSVDTANIPAGQRTSWRILNDKRRQPLLDIRMDKGGVPSATGVNLGAS